MHPEGDVDGDVAPGGSKCLSSGAARLVGVVADDPPEFVGGGVVEREFIEPRESLVEQLAKGRERKFVVDRSGLVDAQQRARDGVRRPLLRVDDDDDDDRSFAPIEDPAPDALTKKRKSAATPARKPSRRVKEKAVPPAPLSNQIADLAIDDDRPLALRRPPRLSALPAPPSPTNALGV